MVETWKTGTEIAKQAKIDDRCRTQQDPGNLIRPQGQGEPNREQPALWQAIRLGRGSGRPL